MLESDRKALAEEYSDCKDSDNLRLHGKGSLRRIHVPTRAGACQWIDLDASAEVIIYSGIEMQTLVPCEIINI